MVLGETRKITVESVDYLASSNCTVGPPLGNSKANGAGFWTLTQGPDWSPGQQLVEKQVLDIDFYDPDRSANKLDKDASKFDQFGLAISFYTGHGVCNPVSGVDPDPANQQSCTSSAQCNQPYAGFTTGYNPESLPGVCKTAPGFPQFPNAGICHYFTNRHLFTCDTAGSADAHAGDVDYSGGEVAWGESSTSGPWADAGTNGGTNLVILNNSCSTLPDFEAKQMIKAYAGMHLFMNVMPVNGDYANVANGGSTLAAQFNANPHGVVSDAWMATLASLQMMFPGACSDLNGMSFGGGGDINGCGAHVAMSFDSDVASAEFHTKMENWLDIQNDDLDAKGTSQFSEDVMCNYDCKTFPFTLQ